MTRRMSEAIARAGAEWVCEVKGEGARWTAKDWVGHVEETYGRNKEAIGEHPGIYLIVLIVDGIPHLCGYDL